MHVGNGHIRVALPWLRTAVFGGGDINLDILFASQFVKSFSRLQRSRDLFGLILLGLRCMFSILACCPTIGPTPRNRNGIMMILACGLALPRWVVPGSINMWCVTLDVLGVCVGTWRRTGVIFNFIVSMLVGIFGVWIGMLLDCLLCRVRLFVRWFAVPYFRQFFSVVGL